MTVEGTGVGSHGGVISQVSCSLEANRQLLHLYGLAAECSRDGPTIRNVRPLGRVVHLLNNFVNLR